MPIALAPALALGDAEQGARRRGSAQANGLLVQLGAGSDKKGDVT
jgi:hypothetical protein